MLAIPAAAVAYGVYRLMNTYDSALTDLEDAKASIKRQVPHHGGIYHAPSKTALLSGHGVPRRVIEGVDLRGVPVWHVDYGAGSLTTMYTPPQTTHQPFVYGK